MKKIAFIFLSVIYIPIVLTIVSNVTGWMLDEKLNGYTDITEMPHFSIDSYLSGEFQAKSTDYFEGMFCPHGVLTKLYSTVQYNLFQLGNQVIGYHNDIFEENYIYAELGLDAWDYSGEWNQLNARNFIEQLEEVQKKLEQFDKTLFFYVSSSKAEVDYSNIPQKYKNMALANPVRGTDYLRSLLEESSIPFIFASDLAERQTYPAYYKTGSHWSCTYEQEVSKVLLEKISKISGKKYRGIKLGEVEVSDRPFSRETDIYDLLNVWNKVDDTYYSYELCKEYPDNYDRLNLLIQGDSFGVGFFTNILETYPNENVYYIDYANYVLNKQHEYDRFDSEWNNLDLPKYLDAVDVIVIEMTPPNMTGYTWGFIEYLSQVLDSYIPNKQNVECCASVLPETLDYIQQGALYGLYKDETGLVWTGEYSEINLKDESIDTNGMEMHFSILKENAVGDNQIYIYINGKMMHKAYLKDVAQESLYFLPDELKGVNVSDGVYCVEIYCTYADNGGDNRPQTGIQLKYIGGKR